MNKLWTLLIIVIAVIAVLGILSVADSETDTWVRSDTRVEHAESLHDRPPSKTHSATTAKMSPPPATKSQPESEQRILDVLLELERKNQNMP
jgi:hypothetical protein